MYSFQDLFRFYRKMIVLIFKFDLKQYFSINLVMFWHLQSACVFIPLTFPSMRHAHEPTIMIEN